ncbi:MAG: hypothetical protein ACO1OQ_00475 [Rufibacter sp.]
MFKNRFALSLSLKVTLAISSIIYICSLFQNGITFLDENGEGLTTGSFSSIELLLYGGIGILGGGLLEWIIWLANPFYFYSIYLLILGKNNAANFILIGSILALSFRAWHEILVSESGRNATIISFDLGYYLWLGSFLLLLFGAIIELRRYESSKRISIKI